jgi:hypothetical protein
MNRELRRMSAGLGSVLIVFGLILIVAANASPIGGPSFAFATIEEGKKVLTEHDDFVSRLSPFDRAARMKTDKEISETVIWSLSAPMSSIGGQKKRRPSNRL